MTASIAGGLAVIGAILFWLNSFPIKTSDSTADASQEWWVSREQTSKEVDIDDSIAHALEYNERGKFDVVLSQKEWIRRYGSLLLRGKRHTCCGPN
ncbi:MAG: hypothetical protein WCP45_11350 [Verrucomicrobiota bacterium]